MYNKLLRTATLPYKTIRGSYELRQQKAASFTRKIMSEIDGQVDEGGISLSKFGRKIKKNLPQNLSFYVDKNRDKSSYAQLSVLYDGKERACEYEFSIELGKTGKIDVSHLPVIVHEVTHLSDYLFHPKTLARSQQIKQSTINLSKYYDFYDKEVYIREKIDKNNTKENVLKRIRKKTKIFMAGWPIKDRINILQDMRYSLISERNAYKKQYKMAKKLHRKNTAVDKDFLEDDTKIYMFDEKIELLKQMTLRFINWERKQNRNLINVGT